jgi:hypothetical protein
MFTNVSMIRFGLLLCALLCVPFTAHAGMEVNINFVLGVKGLDKDDWEESDTQGLFVVQTTFGAPHWPVAIALDSLGSEHSEDRLISSPVLAKVELSRATTEFNAGVRKIWKTGKARPYVGGGFGILSARLEENIQLLVIDDSDSTLGVWLNGGAFWRLGKKFNIGIDVRMSAGEVTVFGRDIQAGGASVGLLLGWGWGGAT